MSDEGFTLDTPEQINMWVLLSRRSQVQMHLKGYKQPGILTALKRDIPGCENITRVKQAVAPIENVIGYHGGRVDYSLVNVQVMRHMGKGVLLDMGVYPDMETVESLPGLVRLYETGELEVQMTTDDVHEPNGTLYTQE